MFQLNLTPGRCGIRSGMQQAAHNRHQLGRVHRLLQINIRLRLGRAEGIRAISRDHHHRYLIPGLCGKKNLAPLSSPSFQSVTTASNRSCARSEIASLAVQQVITE